MTIQQLIDALQAGITAGELQPTDEVLVFCDCRKLDNVVDLSPNGRNVQLNTLGAREMINGVARCAGCGDRYNPEFGHSYCPDCNKLNQSKNQR